MNIHPSIIANLKTSIDSLLIQYPELVEDEVLRADVLEAETTVFDILTRLVEMEGDAKSMAEAISLRIKELGARGARYERRQDAMRLLIQSIMERTDLKKMTLPEATLSTSFRKPTPVILNDEALTDDLCKFVRKPDMEKIKAVIADGVMPAGVSMSNGRAVLTIRRA